jgi:uncharacterized protein (DUF736 family)
MFKNDKKSLPNHPDYRGDCKVDGKLYWMSGWIKETKAGAKFLSISLTPREEQAKPAMPNGFDDDDIPF